MVGIKRILITLTISQAALASANNIGAHNLGSAQLGTAKASTAQPSVAQPSAGSTAASDPIELVQTALSPTKSYDERKKAVETLATKAPVDHQALKSLLIILDTRLPEEAEARRKEALGYVHSSASEALVKIAKKENTQKWPLSIQAYDEISDRLKSCTDYKNSSQIHLITAISHTQSDRLLNLFLDFGNRCLQELDLLNLAEISRDHHVIKILAAISDGLGDYLTELKKDYDVLPSGPLVYGISRDDQRARIAIQFIQNILKLNPEPGIELLRHAAAYTIFKITRYFGDHLTMGDFALAELIALQLVDKDEEVKLRGIQAAAFVSHHREWISILTKYARAPNPSNIREASTYSLGVQLAKGLNEFKNTAPLYHFWKSQTMFDGISAVIENFGRIESQKIEGIDHQTNRIILGQRSKSLRLVAAQSITLIWTIYAPQTIFSSVESEIPPLLSRIPFLNTLYEREHQEADRLALKNQKTESLAHTGIEQFYDSVAGVLGSLEALIDFGSEINRNTKTSDAIRSLVDEFGNEEDLKILKQALTNGREPIQLESE